MRELLREMQAATSYRLLSTPRLLRTSVRLVLAAAGVMSILILFMPWQQTASGPGRVMAFSPGDRVQQITANVEGRVLKWFVREGDRVAEGDLMAKMADNDPEIMSRLERERQAMLKQIRALEVTSRIAAKNQERQRQLLEEGVSAQRTLELAQNDYAKVLKELADMEIAIARLDVRISRQMNQEIRAPRAGIVQTISVGESNALVKPTDVLAQLVPITDDRTVELMIQGRDLPFIKVGQEVRLQFEGWPILQLSGLPQLSTGTFSGIIRVIGPSDDGYGNFRVLVSKRDSDPWPSPEMLRQGVRARGWVQMNRVPLWYEIWRLINDLPPYTVPLDAKAVNSKDKASADTKADDAKDGDAKGK